MPRISRPRDRRSLRGVPRAVYHEPVQRVAHFRGVLSRQGTVLLVVIEEFGRWRYVILSQTTSQGEILKFLLHVARENGCTQLVHLEDERVDLDDSEVTADWLRAWAERNQVDLSGLLDSVKSRDPSGVS